MGEYIRIKIVLIDGNDLFREGIKRILEGSDFEIIRVGSTLDAVVDVIDREPDIVLLDATLYDDQKNEETLQLLEQHPEIKLVLFIDELANYQVLKTLQHGVKGYFTKEMNVSSLLKGLQTVQQGHYWIHPHVSNHLVREFLSECRNAENNEFNHPTIISRPKNIFTEREYQVLELLASGYNNQRIAENLEVTQSTVKNHVTSIFVKMNVHDRTQAVIKAAKNGWVKISYEEPEMV